MEMAKKDRHERKTFFHGTGPDSADCIFREGFRISFDPYGTGDKVRGGGNLGFGVYISSSWRTALSFGNVILQVELARGTKILDAAVPPDKSVLRYLRREFGADILRTASFHRVIPGNKKLTLAEVAALLRYHFERTDKMIWSGASSSEKTARKGYRHASRMHRLGTYLLRYGYSGFGDHQGEVGIVIFQPDRIRPVAVAAELSAAARAYVGWETENGYAAVRSLRHLQSICLKFREKGRVVYHPPTHGQ